MDIVQGQFSDAEEDSTRRTTLTSSMPKNGDAIFFQKKDFSNARYENEDEMESSEEEEEDEVEENNYKVDKNDLEWLCLGKSRNVQCHKPNLNPQNHSNKMMNYQPVDKLFNKYAGKINIDQYECSELRDLKLSDGDRVRIKDKADRATAEQVMDPRTRMILFKLLNRGSIKHIDGCISTGKEANVYHAIGNNDEEHIAIKIYKTSILIFKDRDKYVTGEFRFRHGYCRHNPRKMVRTWAEKEMRNLVRLHTAGLPVPEPKLLKSHVLLMSFLGKNGWPAPKLKDVDISNSKACQLYRDCIIMIWKMFNICKLVHADLSEFNMLYHEGQLYLIDVSQSVEKDHPHALEFLRSDCTNVTEYFRKKEVATMTVKQLFDFITDPSITEKNMEEYLDKAAELTTARELTAEDLLDDEVFKKSYIPKNLYEVIDFERDINQAKSGETNLIYEKLLSLNCEEENKEQEEKSEEKSNEESDSDCDSDSGSHSDSEEGKTTSASSKFVNSRRPRDESPASRNERKKAIKEQKAEKRKSKVKKHIKKRKEKIAHKPHK